MARESEEETWRDIVENFGDRVELPEDPVEVIDLTPPATLEQAPTLSYDDERYVPPPPPPLPLVPHDRLVAWIGLFGSPTILLITLVAGISVPPWLGYLLVAGFVGGFVYLVVKMPRGPGDPWDDGARL